MRKSRYSEEQIIRVLRQVESGQKVKDVIREHGISEQTYYRWRKKYGGLEASEVQELKQLRDENRRLKGLVAEYGYENENRHFVNCFLAGRQPELDSKTGLEVVEMLMAAYMSAEQERTLAWKPERLDTFVPAVARGEWVP